MKGYGLDEERACERYGVIVLGTDYVLLIRSLTVRVLEGIMMRGNTGRGV